MSLPRSLSRIALRLSNFIFQGPESQIENQNQSTTDVADSNTQIEVGIVSTESHASPPFTGTIRDCDRSQGHVHLIRLA